MGPVFSGHRRWNHLAKRALRSNNRTLAARNIVRHAARAITIRAIARAAWCAVALKRMIVWATPLCLEVRTQAKMALARMASAFTSNEHVVEDWRQAGVDLEGDVALFVHHDPEGKVNPQTRQFVRELAEAGLSVVFVTNSGRLLEEEKAFLRIHCAAILVRKNIGYDFGAWRDALETLALPRENTRSILLTNDSIVGPFDGIQKLLGAVDHRAADVWGITESWQRGYHLQSYFLSCGPLAIRSEAWRRFWQSVKPVPSKDWIVRRYEVGFTKSLSTAGLRCRPLFPTARLLDVEERSRLAEIVGACAAVDPDDVLVQGEAIHAARILRTIKSGEMMLNPSADLWRQLLKAGFPFVKRELLMRNPTKIADISDWRGVVEQTFPGGGPLQPPPSIVRLV